jgi:hypothetical protein
VFIPVQHHSVNYPVAYYGGFVPNAPTKLYEDPRVPPQEFGLNSLPQVHVAAVRFKLSRRLRYWHITCKLDNRSMTTTYNDNDNIKNQRITRALELVYATKRMYIDAQSP